MMKELKKILTIKTTEVVFKCLSKLPRKKIIYFESFHGKSYNDQPRAIYEEMIREGLDEELIWGVKKGFEHIFDDYPKVNFVTRFSLKWFYKMGLAKLWVINTRTPHQFVKSRKTTYLQTWHGTPLKKLGLDIEKVSIPGTDNEKYARNFKEESSRWDYLVSPNSYATKVFKGAFGYEGKILEHGYPRNDLLVNKKSDEIYIATLKEKLGVPSEKKIILYAPTWRDDEFYSKGNYRFELPFSVERLMDEHGEEIVLLVRMHYLVSDRFDFIQYGDNVKDVSNYDEMSHLLLVSDVLITDYSSSFFDYAILERPVVFYMYDRDKYANDIRGMYLDVEKELPGPIVETENDLFSYLSKLKMNSYKIQNTSKLHEFKQRFNSNESGQASKFIIKEIL